MNKAQTVILNLFLTYPVILYFFVNLEEPIRLYWILKITAIVCLLKLVPSYWGYLVGR